MVVIGLAGGTAGIGAADIPLRDAHFRKNGARVFGKS